MGVRPKCNRGFTPTARVLIFVSGPTFGASRFLSSSPMLLAMDAPSLAHLTPLDIAVIVIYFVMVIWIGCYLKGQANTSEEFFMAGRGMTGWIAGPSFV